MPITKRIDRYWMVHHVMMRSLEEILLFRDDLDRARFIDFLRETIARFKLDLLAFALMENHVHLVVRRRTIPLWRAIQFLNSSHATAYNMRYKRRGHVFDRCFKSKPVRDLTYQGVATVYVHRNPIVVGMRPEQLAKTPWNGHAVLVGARESAFMNVPMALEPWSDEPDPRAAYQAQMSLACQEYGPFPELFPDGDSPVEEIETPAPIVDVSPELLIAVVLEAVCARTGSTVRSVRGGGRSAEASSARAAASYLIETLLPIPRAKVARALGVSDSGVTRALRRGSAEVANLGFDIAEVSRLVTRHAEWNDASTDR